MGVYRSETRHDRQMRYVRIGLATLVAVTAFALIAWWAA